jgi:hypothetical protein
MKPIVYIIHHVDTEGPLYEDIKETFSRLEEIVGIKLCVKPTNENLRLLRAGKIGNLTSKQQEKVRIVADPHLLAYKKSWAEVDEMLYRILSTNYRNKYIDSFGNGWVFNWHIMDHVGFTVNPRHRDMGYLNIFDHYESILDETDSNVIDEINWHFHPVPFDKKANTCATSYENCYDILHQILSRRLVEKHWFPLVNRAGMHTERPDSNWFLEQWIPFDASNQSINNDDYLTYGRYGDWSGAPSDWSIYHPNIYDWRQKGNCNRYIARCLNMHTRFRNLSETELGSAFDLAQYTGKNVYVGVTNHDFREISTEIDEFYAMLKRVQAKYDVDIKFTKSTTAFKEILGLDQSKKLDFKTSLDGNVLTIQFTEGEPFGPQPYLAIKTKSGEYRHDNLDFGEFKKTYYYTFDYNTTELDQIDCVVIGTNDKFGNQCVKEVNFNI